MYMKVYAPYIRKHTEGTEQARQWPCELGHYDL